MTMSAKGLAKLLEELGECAQVAAKKLAYIDVDEHPDGNGSLAKRLEDELADVAAASQFVCEKFNLDITRMQYRAIEKLDRFRKWDADPTC